jgi:hypothetical protein
MLPRIVCERDRIFRLHMLSTNDLLDSGVDVVTPCGMRPEAMWFILKDEEQIVHGRELTEES